MAAANLINLLAERERRVILRHQSDGYVELRPLLDDLGIEVEEKDLPDDVSGHAFYVEGRSRSGFVIVVNKNHPITRRRFTAAHEIGHCLLHADEVKGKGVGDLLDLVRRHDEPDYYPEFDIVAYDPFVDENIAVMESEADCFAAELLMPCSAIRRAKRSGVWRYRDLARAFGVSEAALKRRLRDMQKNGKGSAARRRQRETGVAA